MNLQNEPNPSNCQRHRYTSLDPEDAAGLDKHPHAVREGSRGVSGEMEKRGVSGGTAAWDLLTWRKGHTSLWGGQRLSVRRAWPVVISRPPTLNQPGQLSRGLVPGAPAVPQIQPLGGGGELGLHSHHPTDGLVGEKQSVLHPSSTDQNAHQLPACPCQRRGAPAVSPHRSFGRVKTVPRQLPSL